MRLMIDTNAYGDFLKGTPSRVEAIASAEEILVPAIVLGELRSGFRGGSREEANLLSLEQFLSSPRVRIHNIGETTAIFYAEVHGSLKNSGNPIPTNDLWIAASALETGSILLTRDSHFGAVPGIIVK
jgi:predicted nucleic acid-binding protein